MFGRAKIAMLAAELLGTGLLTLTALMLMHTTIITYFIASTLAITYALMVLFFGHASGGHFNPAVTFGLWAVRRFETLPAVVAIVAQFLGAALAWALFTYLANQGVDNLNAKFEWRMLVAEMVGTAVLMMGVMAALTRGFDTTTRFVTIAAAVFSGGMLAHICARGLLNPALALGVRSWGWVYVVGPLLGGVVGAYIYNYLFSPAPAKVSTRVTTSSRSEKTAPATTTKSTAKTGKAKARRRK